ncbi:hypothetical protein J2I47_14280 [Fibrella sp. HMF5335]|uniref:Uncharacterized protein n=1 Tax=Fibrella rubiginis TaxID=2817060 RepID=A0A939GEM2_9BACT|nr:hypothetical protein [Fibrella rubiginis]MBO0937722.1 hypothetical protein [Fibrella rubiginis]
MGTNTNEQHMLDQTLAAFRGDLSVLPQPQAGATLIDGWLDALPGNVGVEGLEANLTKLRDLLSSGDPEPAQLKQLLHNLSTDAATHAEAPTAEGTWTGKLESLSIVLKNIAETL